MTGNKRFLQSRHNCIDRIKKRRTDKWDTVIDWLNELNDECGRLNIICNAKERTIKNLLEMGTEVEKENEKLIELLYFANTLIASQTSSDCQEKWKQKLGESKE